MKFHQVNKEGKRKVIQAEGTASVKVWEGEPARCVWESIWGPEAGGWGEDGGQGLED